MTPIMERAPIRSVAVVGGGIVALSAALAFRQSLPQVRVILVPAPVDAAALADTAPVGLSSLSRFHAEIGLGEADLVRAGAANPRIGTIVEGWPDRQASFAQVHGQYGRDLNGAAFHELWARALLAGQALPFDRYAAAAVLARADRFVHPEDDPRSPLSTYDYSLRLHPGRYQALLTRLARARGVEVTRSRFSAAEAGTAGRLSGVRLSDGARVEADLFVDCAGPAAPLLSALDAAFEDWSGWQPCVRIDVLSGPASVPEAADRVAATADGWLWRYAAPGGGLHVRVSAEAEGGARLRPGRRPQPFLGNVLALGDAATGVDPLGGLNLHLAHRALRRALELLPGRDCSAVEIGEYNRRAEQETLLVRDFLALHYLHHPTLHARVEPPPDRLAQLLDQFRRRGRLPVLEDDPIGREGWIAALIGLGVVPQATSPLADRADPAQAAALMGDLATGFASLPGQLPAYKAYLRRMGAPDL